MKKITNWKKFNEDIYPGWTSTLSNKPVFQSSAREPKEAQPLPEKEYKLTLRCKIAAERTIEDICPDVFSSGDIDDIVSKLEDYGFSADWFADEIEYFKKHGGPSDPGDEPDENDYEDVDDYNSDLEEYETAKEEFENWDDMSDDDLLDRYIKENYNNKWDKFLDSFDESGTISEVFNSDDRNELFNSLVEIFNRDLYENMSNGVPVIRELVENIIVVGDDFVNDGYYELEITTNTEIDLDFWEDTLEEALIDEFNYGVGDKLDNTRPECILTYWDGDNNNKKFGKFEILVDKFRTYEFQKQFISEHPDEFEKLEKYGYHKDIKTEYDHLFGARDMGLL